MAPDHNVSTVGHSWLEPNRYSSRILNKSVQKLDISTINTKIDFMRSLSLFCIANTKESVEKVNWDVVTPNNCLPLKTCSVVIENCNNLFVPSRSNTNENSSVKIINEEVKQKDNTRKIKKEKSTRKMSERRKSKEAVTKVTLKIGSEVISKVYCKNKYISKTCSDEEGKSRVHIAENCDDCKENETTLPHAVQNTESIDSERSKVIRDDRNIERIYKLAAALVEHEVQQSWLQSSSDAGGYDVNDADSDSVVPDLSEQVIKMKDSSNNNISDVPATYSTHESTNVCRSLSNIKKPSDHEVIVIEDDVLDDCEDDCVIIEERSECKGLRDEECSYILHISNESGSTVTKRETLDNYDIENIHKKPGSLCNSQGKILENSSSYNMQKEKSSFQENEFKVKHSAMPLRQLNF